METGSTIIAMAVQAGSLWSTRVQDNTAVEWESNSKYLEYWSNEVLEYCRNYFAQILFKQVRGLEATDHLSLLGRGQID